MNQIIKGIYNELGIAFTAGCTDEGGEWVSNEVIANPQISLLVQSFYQKYYGTEIRTASQIEDLNLASLGWCVTQNDQDACNALGEYARFENGICNLQPAWYQDHCVTVLGGQWDGTNCSIDMNQQIDTGSDE